MSISISSEVLGTLSVTVAETTGTLEVAVLATAPAILSVELGTPGPAATVTVGSTTTLSAGSSATVTNAGTSLAAVLNFGIPQGPTGATGAQGPAGTSGIVYATSPLSYNSGTQTVSIDLSAYAPKASPTFTGDPKAPTPATSDNDTSIATTAFVKAQGYATTDALASYALLAGSSNFQVTSGTIKSMASDDNFVQLNETRLEFGNGVTVSGLSVTGTGITFADSTVQTTAAVSGIPDAPSDSQTYGRNNGAWTVVSGGGSFNGGAVANPITIAGTTIDSEMSSDYFGVELSSDHSQFAELEYNKLTVANGSGSMQVTPAGITFTDSTVQYTAFNPYDYATLASPTFTGTPAAPTATTGDSSTQIATTAFVQDAIIAGSAHAETLQATVRNSTGSTISPFTVVYINGALGNKATVAKAQANSEATSSGTFAVTQASIANNADGIVISAGVLSNVDTSAYTDGDKLYLSPTTAGGVTTTKPSAPNHLVYVGVVTRAHPTQGTVSVRIQNGYELDELHDVAIASKTNLDLLAYESSTSLWKNKSFSTLGLLTSSTAASTYAPLASPTFTGTVTIPAGASISGFAPLASPSLTGTPLAPTASVGTNTTQIATTAFVLANAGSGGGGCDVQTFGSSSSSGSFTWTKPAGAKWVEFLLIGGGGGGGSGCRSATSVNRAGGGGGAGGTTYYGRINASYVGATQTVVVGAGGTGGAAQTVDSTIGNSGGSSSSTTFSLFTSGSGGSGTGGGTTNGAAGSARNSMIFLTATANSGSGAGTLTTGSTGISQNVHLIGAGGGGGGGAAAASTTNAAGGVGAGFGSASPSAGLLSVVAGGSGGTTGGTAATSGTSATTQYFFGGTGGGGGFYRTGQAGGTGGAGGWPGGSGGGGGASDNGFASGAGGAGANGFAVIITYF